MRKVDFLKNTLKFCVLSWNLLNCNAMEYIYDINKNKEEYNYNINNSHEILKKKVGEIIRYSYTINGSQISNLDIKEIGKDKEILIMQLGTEKGYRRKGYAKSLFLKMLNDCIYNSNNKICLPTFFVLSSEMGTHFYEKFGFKATGETFNGYPKYILEWDSAKIGGCLTLNKNNEIVLKNNNIDNNNNINNDINNNNNINNDINNNNNGNNNIDNNNNINNNNNNYDSDDDIL